MARLKTSKETMDILKNIQKRSNLRPNILARIAINLSISYNNKLSKEDYDNDGLEFRKETLFGDYEILFKALMTRVLEKKLRDEEFFPDYTKLFLENGTRLLKREYEFAGNYDTFLINLLK